MTDELNRLSSDREETDRDASMPTGANTDTAMMEPLEDDSPCEVTVEVLPDWLKPMEEDDDAVENEKTVVRRTRKTNPHIVKVKRGRGRPPLPKNVRARLDKIKALKGSGGVQAKSVNTPNKRRRSRRSITDPGPTQTPEVLPRTARSPISTPHRFQLTPLSPAAAITIFSPQQFRSPPRLTRVSPLNVDGTRIPCHSPSVQLSNVSQQLSPATPGNNGIQLPAHLWQCPPLQPLSPRGAFVDQTVTIESQDFPNAIFNGKETEKQEILLLIRDCVGCGCQFPAENVGDSLCRKCKPDKKSSPPNIVFRKNSNPNFKKKMKKDFVPDGDEEDEDYDDDDQLDGSKGLTKQERAKYKKRNSRMCQQCDACMRDKDCGVCDFCMDKPKYGGSNKKRQKCRLRQCQFQSKLCHQMKELARSPRRNKNIKQKFKARGRPRSRKRRNRRNPWEDDDDDDDDDDEDDITDTADEMEKMKRPKPKGTRRRARKKWSYSFKEEEEEMFVEAVVDDVEADENESDSLSLVQNEPVKMIGANSQHLNGFSVNQTPQSQEIYYTMPGVPEASNMLSPVTVRNDHSEPPNEPSAAASPLPPEISQNDILQIEMVRVGSPVSQFINPENTTRPEQHGDSTEHTPVITQIFSLAAGTETDFERDVGLMELFSSLRQTLLPAHWVGVMAKGPILQLLQCSKLSTMADTVVQIEKGFFYQISVQNQPLLLMHSIYVKHPTCLTSVGDVVSLLLDLEGMSVCQGHQSFNTGSPGEPNMCVRAALCDLLIPRDEEQCEKCARPAEV
ncbi:methyl-CpG-binding domain protein 1a isoform X2 [Paramisgurnus dabryanus]|uniref:methyl-CpG-binding domain protein 1a isoform X2 n=1 Tax=Paramisgurnus dabryanus TaxID=90735 RepID=UPI0031F424CD